MLKTIKISEKKLVISKFDIILPEMIVFNNQTSQIIKVSFFKQIKYTVNILPLFIDVVCFSLALCKITCVISLTILLKTVVFLLLKKDMYFIPSRFCSLYSSIYGASSA